MTIRVGNAAAPRWFDLSLTRLGEYIDFIRSCGATSTELVLHAGPSDERIARVHILENDWLPVFEQFRNRGIVCHVHAPLDPRFSLARWRIDKEELKRDLAPVMRAVSTFADCQGESTIFVVHAASGSDAETTTRRALEWITEAFERSSSGVLVSVELRRPADANDSRFDRNPNTLAGFVRSLNRTNLGICWDLVNDVETTGKASGSGPSQRNSFLELVNHVHLHDFRDNSADGHHPLSNERLLWRPLLRQLLGIGHTGAITLEIRYRHALAQGDPWTLLADSYNRLLSFLDSELTSEKDSETVQHSHRR